jgi:hypothetical protein
MMKVFTSETFHLKLIIDGLKSAPAKRLSALVGKLKFKHVHQPLRRQTQGFGTLGLIFL